MLGVKHAEAIAELRGVPVIVDIDKQRCNQVAKQIREEFNVNCIAAPADITDPQQVVELRDRLSKECNNFDILINNAANNPLVGSGGLDPVHSSRMEALPLEVWNQDIAVGLTGAFLCARTFGEVMAEQGKGVILNIAGNPAIFGGFQ